MVAPLRCIWLHLWADCGSERPESFSPPLSPLQRARVISLLHEQHPRSHDQQRSASYPATPEPCQSHLRHRAGIIGHHREPGLANPLLAGKPQALLTGSSSRLVPRFAQQWSGVHQVTVACCCRVGVIEVLKSSAQHVEETVTLPPRSTGIAARIGIQQIVQIAVCRRWPRQGPLMITPPGASRVQAPGRHIRSSRSGPRICGPRLVVPGRPGKHKARLTSQVTASAQISILSHPMQARRTA